MLEALHQYLWYCANVGVYSELHWYIAKILAFFSRNSTVHMLVFTQKQIEDRLSAPSEKSGLQSGGNDFLSKLLRMHGDNPDKFTMTDVFSTCITNIGAGSDTTSISLSAILYHIIKTPSSMAKVSHSVEVPLHVRAQFPWLTLGSP